MPGAAITEVTIDGVLHEYSTLEGVKEDATKHSMENLIDIKEQAKWRKDANVLCNNISGAKIVKTLERLGRPTLIVECPGSLDSSSVKLQTLSFVPRQNNSNEIITYNVTLLDECERLDIQYFSTFTGHYTKIGMTTSFKGNRNRVLEWATYHHHIGIDHFWIYVNEPWDSLGEKNSLPYREYITWIPYNFSVAHDYFTRRHNYIPTEHFRIASQNDALWRAKRMGMEWLAIIDLDEYIVCGNQQQRNMSSVAKSATGGELKQYLTNKFEDEILETFGAIEMNSVPFGHNTGITEGWMNGPTDISMDGSSNHSATVATIVSPDSDKDHSTNKLLIGYTWRQKGDPNSFPLRRMKLIINPHKVTAVNIHYLGGGDRTGVQVWSAPANELRINHYRTPEDGVYDQKHGKLGLFEIEQDTSLRDRYQEVVLEKMILEQ
jgi:hypothetical protein